MTKATLSLCSLKDVLIIILCRVRREVGYAVLSNRPEELNQIRLRIKESIVRDKQNKPGCSLNITFVSHVFLSVL